MDQQHSISFEKAVEEFIFILSRASLNCAERFELLLELACRYLKMDVGGVVISKDGSLEVSTLVTTKSRDVRDYSQTDFNFPSSFAESTFNTDDVYCYIESSRSKFIRYRSFIGYRLIVNGEKYGLIGFLSEAIERKEFLVTEKTFIRMLAVAVERQFEREVFVKVLEHQREFEKFMTTISTEFINLPLEKVDDGIRDALRKIALFANVNFSYVFLFKNNNTKMDIAYWWIDNNSEPRFRLKNIEVKKYKASLNPILNREVVDFPDIEALGEEALAEKKIAAFQQVRSAILVPMIYINNCIGLVGFASRKSRQSYDPEQVKLLKMASNILASAVEYRRACEAVKSLELQMFNAQKLESLGVLAGGIAHDFNNLLMGILGNAGLALQSSPPRSGSRIYIRRIEKITQRAADLTNQLLAYSGKGKFFVEPLNLSEIIAEMSELLDALLPKRHYIRFNLADDLPDIKGDESQLSQVVMNLVLNAADASAGKPAVITISTGLISVDRDFLMGAYLCDETTEGVYAYLEVSDNGCGMDSQTVSKIFDPFFTTKSSGHGLGLASVLGIARAHCGIVRVKSEISKGTKITVLFPCCGKQEARAETEAASSIEQLNSRGLILVVDDEEWVRDVVSEYLKQYGFGVLTAESGETALSIFKETSARIDVAIVDMSMPDMDGLNLYDEMLRISPYVKVILSSGYAEQQIAKQCENRSLAGFIQKPYVPESLVEKLIEVLSST